MAMARAWARRREASQADGQAEGGGKGRREEGESGGVEGGDASLADWAVPPSSSRSALTAALGGNSLSLAPQGGIKQGGVAPLKVGSQGIQTSDSAVGPEDSEGIFSNGAVQLADLEDGEAWLESDSPQGYVIPSVPAEMLDQSGVAAAEYERVPLQRDCSTQTPTNLLPATSNSTAGRSGDAAWRQQGGSEGGSWAGVGHPPITANSKLEDILSAFGHQGGPALHHRLGASHPFGPSYLYAYRGVVFEVLQNGLIATVTLFKP